MLRAFFMNTPPPNLKAMAAQAALAYIPANSIIGVGTGSTVNYLIDMLAGLPIAAAVASSTATAQRLARVGIPLVELNTVSQLAVYIDGADEITPQLFMTKGGGAALTREKIVASVAAQFVCIADHSKWVSQLGSSFALPVEVIPMAEASVTRALQAMGGKPITRPGVLTDNGNIIVDVHDFIIADPVDLESKINNIVGVVCHGVFAQRKADVALIAHPNGVTTHT